MKRSTSRKSHSWWWDSHINLKNSRWLSENLEKMDRLIKEMLKLIEEEGDSFAKKADMYYLRRPELLSHVGDFYRMYRALAERYDTLTGELRKNIPSELQSQSSGSGSDFGTETASPSFFPSADFTPKRKQNIPKPFSRAAGFDVFLGSTASSDFSGKFSDDDFSSSRNHDMELPQVPDSSSSSSKSDSDSEDGKVVDAYENTSRLNDRIIQQEDELRELREKLKEYEKSSNGQCAHFVGTDEHQDPEDKFVAEVAEVETELHPEPEDRTVVLEAEISNHKGEINCLKEAMEAAAKQFEAEISLKDRTIEEYKTQLDAAMNKFMQEKTTLEAELKSSIADLKLEAEQISEKKSCLEIRISELEQMIKELKAMSAESSERLLHEKSMLESKVFSLMESEKIQASKLQALEDRVREMDAEKTEACNESAKHIDELNRSLDGSKLKIDMLTSEKDDLNARVSKLVDDVKCQDDNCQSMSDHLHQLHVEHVNLIKENEEARQESAELMNRVSELEEEVEKQRILILDGAEGKREAIRQLCFSLEHYRDGYENLRQMLQGHNRRLVVMAT